MKFLIVRMRKNGMCHCWSNGTVQERSVMAGVALGEGIALAAKKMNATFADAFQKFFDSLKTGDDVEK